MCDGIASFLLEVNESTGDESDGRRSVELAYGDFTVVIVCVPV